MGMESGISMAPQKSQLEIKRERAKRKELLKKQIVGISGEINKEMADQHGIDSFVNSEGGINMETYVRDGIIDPGLYASHKQKVESLEIEFSGVEVESRREFYKDEYGVETTEEMLEVYRRKRGESKGNQLEMAVTSVFHRLFKEEFIVVRASAYDDYINGVDNVIVNKKTGAVICALDEVDDTKGGDRHRKKKDRIRKAKSGGTTLEYGFTFEKGKVVRKKIESLPIFCVQLSPSEVDELLGDINLGLQSGASGKELDHAGKILADLEDQTKDMKGSLKFLSEPALKINLDSFSQSLVRMKEIIEEKMG
jgi:hypothetical protein